MRKRNAYAFITCLMALSGLLGIQIVTLHTQHADHASIKKNFVAFCGLPDLSIANEALYVRFRSYADVFSSFSNGPELREFAPSTFTYAPSHTPNPSRIERAHK